MGAAWVRRHEVGDYARHSTREAHEALVIFGHDSDTSPQQDKTRHEAGFCGLRGNESSPGSVGHDSVADQAAASN